MERNVSPKVLLKWRFQQALYRAYYDAVTRRRLLYETELEQEAMEVLSQASELGAIHAVDRAEAILDRAVTNRVAVEWRSRVF